MFCSATHNSPRVWFLTSAFSPLAVRLIKALLDHGDCIAVGLILQEAEDDEDRSREFRDLISECMSEERKGDEWKSRIRGIRCDGRAPGHCGAAIAEAIQVFGHIDILLCCTSEGAHKNICFMLNSLHENCCESFANSSAKWWSARLKK